MQKILYLLLVLILVAGIVLTILPMKDFKTAYQNVPKKDKTEAIVGHSLAGIAAIVAVVWLGLVVYKY